MISKKVSTRSEDWQRKYYGRGVIRRGKLFLILNLVFLVLILNVRNGWRII